jgi:YfiH family protein
MRPAAERAVDRATPWVAVADDSLPRLEPDWVEAGVGDGGADANPIVVAVTTRPLNFGRETDAPANEVSAAHRALRGWAWPRFRLVMGASQVHGVRLFRADGVAIPETTATGPAVVRLAGYDGFLTATPGVLLTVGVADCVPAFLQAPGVGALALLHAGWRGVAAGILEQGVAALEAAYGAAPGDLLAWWGPAIGPCCYPVGEEVVEAIRSSSAGPGTEEWIERREGGWRVDLRAALSRQAAAVGIRAKGVRASSRCTSCDPLLHSYRAAGGGGGRMLAIAGRPLGGLP